MQCACALLSSVVGPNVQYISTLSLNRQDLRKKVTENKMCVSSFSTTFVGNIFILRRIERDMTENL